MLRSGWLAWWIVLAAAASSDAAILVSSDGGTETPGLPGFRTYTLTAVSDGAPIQGFDFVGDPTAPVDPGTSRGIFGPLNQLTLPAPLTTVWNDNNALLPLLIPGSNAQQDSHFLFNSSDLLVIPGSARETATSLQAAFSTPTDFGNSVQFAQIVLPTGATATLRGVVGTTDGMEFPISVGGPPPVPPLVIDTDLGDVTRGSTVSHTFHTSAGELPIAWGNLMVGGPGPPAIAPVLTPGGVFSWDSAGSPLGQYNFDVTATNAGGSDVGRLSLNLVAPPPVAPVVVDVFADVLPGNSIMHTFTAIDPDTPAANLTWSNFSFEGSGVAIQPLFDALTQQFSWNTAGSPEGLYTARVTVSDPEGGTDTGMLQVFVGNTGVPEPSSVVLAMFLFASLASAGLANRRRTWSDRRRPRPVKPCRL